MINKVRAWEAKILRLTFRARMMLDETWVGYRMRTSTSRYDKGLLEEDGSARC